MRELDAVEEFDVVLNLFSAFGYFVEQADDERVLRAVARALVSGGRFFIDTLNPITLASRFAERDWRDLPGGFTLLERRSWDQLRGADRRDVDVRAEGRRALAVNTVWHPKARSWAGLLRTQPCQWPRADCILTPAR